MYTFQFFKTFCTNVYLFDYQITMIVFMPVAAFLFPFTGENTILFLNFYIISWFLVLFLFRFYKFEKFFGFKKGYYLILISKESIPPCIKNTYDFFLSRSTSNGNHYFIVKFPNKEYALKEKLRLGFETRNFDKKAKIKLSEIISEEKPYTYIED